MLWGVSTLNYSIFQNFDFSRFSIDRIYLSTDRNCDKNFGLNLPGLIGIQLMLDQLKLKNFLFLNIRPNFFHASCMFRIHMHCIVFCIHLAVLQSYLSLFSHITYIHFAKLGTQLDLKIDWLIFEFFALFSISYFSWWNAEN